MTAARRACIQAWMMVIAWMALIFGLSAQPQLPNLGLGPADLQDILGHFLVYAGLAFWLARALRRTPAVRRPLAWTLALAMLYALSDELHQAFVPNRHPDPFDILVDTLGIVAFLGVAWALPRRRGAEKGRSRSGGADEDVAKEAVLLHDDLPTLHQLQHRQQRDDDLDA